MLSTIIYVLLSILCKRLHDSTVVSGVDKHDIFEYIFAKVRVLINALKFVQNTDGLYLS